MELAANRRSRLMAPTVLRWVSFFVVPTEPPIARQRSDS